MLREVTCQRSTCPSSVARDRVDQRGLARAGSPVSSSGRRRCSAAFTASTISAWAGRWRRIGVFHDKFLGHRLRVVAEAPPRWCVGDTSRGLRRGRPCRRATPNAPLVVRPRSGLRGRSSQDPSGDGVVAAAATSVCQPADAPLLEARCRRPIAPAGRCKLGPARPGASRIAAWRRRQPTACDYPLGVTTCL